MGFANEFLHRFAGLAVERSGNLYLAGQPDLAALEAARDAGVVAVVNLRRSVEMTWDEASAVEQLGLAYYHVPVGGSNDRSAAFAEVDRIVAELETLVQPRSHQFGMKLIFVQEP